ncbi:MAG: hypothetical protein ACXVCH_18590, partial [Bdellovibrionota bacterium]
MESVPAVSEVRRLATPANVALRPGNMKINTEKNATPPYASPDVIAQGRGLRTDGPKTEVKRISAPPTASIAALAQNCSSVKNARLSGAPEERSEKRRQFHF